MIETVVSEINAAIEAGNVVAGKQTFIGIAKLHTEDNEKYPAIRMPGERWHSLIPDDKENLSVYHRVLSIDQDTDDAFDFAFESGPTTDVYNMAAFVVLGSEYDYDECIQVKNLFPSTSTGYTFIAAGEIVTDQDEIVEQEWGNTLDYNQHKTRFNIFQINYTVEINKCHG